MRDARTLTPVLRTLKQYAIQMSVRRTADAMDMLFHGRDAPRPQLVLVGASLASWIRWRVPTLLTFQQKQIGGIEIFCNLT
jgi:hypothetical protein